MKRLLALAVVATLAGCGSADPPAAPTPTPTAAFSVVRAKPRDPRPAGRFLTARLVRRTALRSGPGGRTLHRLGVRTEFGSPTTLGVVGRRGRWLRVVSAKLPNHRTAWVPAANVRLDGTDYEIRVDRSAHRATLVHGGKRVLRFPVAVGRPGNETPLGRYAVTDKLEPTDGTSPYGCCALALSGHQTKLEPGWPGGDRLAIHGTPATWSIGKAVSLGCMRAPERALRRLMRSVPLGAPVVVRA